MYAGKSNKPLTVAEPLTKRQLAAMRKAAAKSWREIKATAERERARAPLVTCPSSRHAHIMADALWTRGEYPMFTEEPKHCAETLYAVIASLWEARHRIIELEKQLERA